MPEIIGDTKAPKKSKRLAAGCAVVGCGTAAVGTVGLAALLAAVKLGVFATNEQIIPEAAPVADAATDTGTAPAAPTDAPATATEASPEAPVAPPTEATPAAPVLPPAAEAPVAPAVAPTTPAAEPIKNTALPKGWELAPEVFTRRNATDAQKAEAVKNTGNCAAYTFTCEAGAFKAQSDGFAYADGCPTPTSDWKVSSKGEVTIAAQGDGTYEKAMPLPYVVCAEAPTVTGTVIHYFKEAKSSK
jgi:hypothetical protein